MALIWKTELQGVHYEVRRAGRTLRLYANGVQHSEFHPKRLLTGSVWDLLWLPALLHEPSRFRRVLVLGLGGGSLIPPIRQLLNPDTLVAVELDPAHLQVAREVFGMEAFGVETHEGDAQAWLRAYRGEPFDLIIEDAVVGSKLIKEMKGAQGFISKNLKALCETGKPAFSGRMVGLLGPIFAMMAKPQQQMPL